MRTALSRNVKIEGHRTSVRLEMPMWDALDDICQREGKTLNEICADVSNRRREGGFTSALRVFILNYYRHSNAASESVAETIESPAGEN